MSSHNFAVHLKRENLICESAKLQLNDTRYVGVTICT